MKIKIWIIIVVAVLGLPACDVEPKSTKGFRLPDGDPEKGKAAFLSLQCHSCHQVLGVELPAPSSKSPIHVPLGGGVTKLRSYGDLVTSIINPSHSLTPGFEHTQVEGSKLSSMPEYNRVMTVGQMIDLVAFLHPQYKQLDPGPYYILP
jgi:sulfur-oxidizing protein SoxX